MSNINNKLDYLDETKQLIKQAIIEKGQEVSDEDTFRSYVDKISDIETGNDTKDATATSNDILYPETAYISNGKVTGNIMPAYSSNTTLSQTNTISRSLSYSLLDINYDAKIAIVSDEDYKFNFCNIVNNEIDYENSTYITLNDFEEGMDGTYTFSKCCTNFDKNTNDLYLYLLFTFQNTFKVFCYTYNIKTKSSKYIDTYELAIDDANNNLVLNMMIRPNYPNQVIVFCGYTSTTTLGSYLTTIFLQFNTVALELQKIEDTISTSANQYAALVESCYFTSNGEYLCINVRTGTLSGTTQNGVIYHCVNNFLESIVDSTRYITLFENGNYIAYNQPTRNHCLFNINGDVLHSYSGNLGEVSTEQLTYTNKCILGNYLFGFAYPEDFINPTEPLILYCCKLNEDYTITKEYEINVGSRTLFNCYNAILYDNKTTRNFDGYLGDTEKEIISLERNNTVYFSTKDSDVTKNDVLQGKIFYNSEGKQIGNKIFTDYNDSVGILETNSAISATAVDQLIGVEMTITPNIEYLDKVKVNDIIKAVITIIDVATSSTTLKCNCLVQILEIIDYSDKQFKANIRILAADVNTEDGTATSEDIAEGKIAYVDNKRVHGSVILPEEHTTEQQSGLSILEIASPGTVNVDSVHRTSCMVKNRLISVSSTNISIYDITNSTSKSFSLTDLIGSTFNTNVISIGANNPNNIGSDYYYILLSNLSNQCYLLLYNYIENKIYSQDDNDINGCKCVISFAPGSNNRLGIIAEKHNKIAFTYQIALNAGGSSRGQVYLGTIDYVKGFVSISQIFNSDGFWAAFPVWYNNDKALATSTFFNSGQWNGEKRIFLFDEDINTYTTITLQGRRDGQSQGFTFSSDLSLCMRGLDLYRVNYVESARTLSLSLLKEDALQLDGYTESDTHYQTTAMRFSKDNQFLIVKDTSTTIKLFAIDDKFNWNLLSSYNTEACNFLTNSIDTDQDILCTSGNINNIISIDIIQDRQSYMTYNNKTYYSYIDCGLTTSKSQVLSNVRFLGSTGIERGTMPNNGNLTYIPSENKQSIPAGYTSGGTILPYNITQSQDYQSCLGKVNLILGDSFIQYKQIEYIETSGTQYIDTDIFIDKTMKLIIKYIPMLISGGQCLLGGTNTNDHWYAAGYNAHNNCSGGQILGTNITITEDVKTEVVTLTLNDNNTIKYQSDTISVSKNISYNNDNYTLRLFNCKRYNEKGNIRFYSLEIYNRNNELIHNLVPVIDLIADECMLQDIITDKKYTNSGSGKFIQGGIK